MKRSAWFFNSLTALILVAVLFFAWPMHVLTSWTITVPDKAYDAGTPVSFTSNSVKHFNADATSNRFLECDMPSGGSVDVPISTTYPQHKTGTHTTTTMVTLPMVPTPGAFRCRILVYVHYKLFSIKPIEQDNQTNDFTVVSKPLGVQ